MAAAPAAAERSLLLLLPMSEHIAQPLVVQVACCIDGCKLEHLVDLQERGVRPGWGRKPKGPQGELQPLNSTFLPSGSVLWGVGGGTLQREARLGPDHAVSPTSAQPPAAPGVLWAVHGFPRGPWGKQVVGAKGPNLFSGHLVGLGHQQPLDAEDTEGGAQSGLTLTDPGHQEPFLTPTG